MLGAIARAWGRFRADADKDRRIWSRGGDAARGIPGRSLAGQDVTLTGAMQLSAAYACVRLLAQTVGKMPLAFYQKTADGGRVQVESPLSDVFSIQANEDQTGSEFVGTMTAWLAAQGNSYAERNEVAGLGVVGLTNLPNCAPYRRPKDNVLEYHFWDRGQRVVLPRDKVWHLRGLLLAGDLGVSPVVAGVNSIGAARAAETAAGSMFASGLQPSGMLSVDAALNPEQRDQFQEILDRFTGSDRFGKAMVLDKRMKWESAQFNAEDSQLLETRRFGIEEICRWWGVPPILVGHAAQGQTMWGTGVEQIVLAWLFTGLDAFLTLIEDRIRADLIPAPQRRALYAEFNREALLAIDSQAKAQFMSTMAQNGFMTRNEGRRKMNWPAVPGGDVATVQSNLIPLDQLGQVADTPEAALANAVRRLFASTEEKPHGKA